MTLRIYNQTVQWSRSTKRTQHLPLLPIFTEELREPCAINTSLSAEQPNVVIDPSSERHSRNTQANHHTRNVAGTSAKRPAMKSIKIPYPSTKKSAHDRWFAKNIVFPGSNLLDVFVTCGLIRRYSQNYTMKTTAETNKMGLFPTAHSLVNQSLDSKPRGDDSHLYFYQNALTLMKRIRRIDLI